MEGRKKKSKNVHPQVSIFKNILAGPLCPRARVKSLMRFYQNLNPCVKCRCHRCLQKNTFKSQWFEHNLQVFHGIYFNIYIKNQNTKTTHHWDSPHHHKYLLPYEENIWNNHLSMITAIGYICYECNHRWSWIKLNWWYVRAKMITYSWRRSDLNT